LELASASPATEKGALGIGGSPSTEHRRYEQPKAAPLFESSKADQDFGKKHVDISEAEKLARLLASLLAPSVIDGLNLSSDASIKGHRTALVCTPQEHRETIARPLTENGYEVFVAEDTKQAVERMRENLISVVLLDPQFDPVEQGAAFVVREVNVLRPSQRRRVFFVLLSPTLRTMDAHAAFLNNVNVIINAKEIANLPKILDHALREYNELYKDLNAALNLPAI